MDKRREQRAACGHSLEQLIMTQTGHSIRPNESLRDFARSLSAEDRRRLRKALPRYEKDCSRNCLELRSALTVSAFRGLGGLGKILGRGAAAGVAVAGVVNTVAPGFYYVGLSSLARAIINVPVIGGLFTKIGLITVSLITPPQAAQSLILVLGGAIGIAVYALFVFIRWLIRKTAGAR